MSRRMRQIEQAILAKGTVDSQQLARLRGEIGANGPIDRRQADFLVELHARLQNRTPSFEQFFYGAIKAYILADSWIDAEQAGWLRRMLCSNGTMGALACKFLHELKNEVKHGSREFEALLADSIHHCPEQPAYGDQQPSSANAARDEHITDVSKVSN